MTTPFFRGFNRTDFLFNAALARALIWNNQAQVKSIFQTFDAGAFTFIPGSLFVPDTSVYVTRDFVFVTVKGTEGVAQWVGNFLGSAQVPISGIAGQVASYFGTVAGEVYNATAAIVLPALSSRKLVLLGHSLGGAVCQCLLSMFLSSAAQGATCLTLGSPRVGNAAFAADVAGGVWRIEAQRDPIVCLPPSVWAGVGSAFPVSGQPPVAFYVGAGSVQTLHDNGDLVDGEQHISIDEVAAQLVSAAAPTHLTSWYVNGLLAQSDLSSLPLGGDGFENPPKLYSIITSQLENPLDGRSVSILDGGASMLMQGTMFFSDSLFSEGWSEQIYANSDVAGMNNLLNSLIPYRQRMLAANCRIHAIRSSQVGATKLSQVTKFATPFYGQYPKDTDLASNAILYLLKTAANSRRIYTFRGIGGDMLDGNNLTTAGRGALPNFDSFCNRLLAGSCGCKFIDSALTPGDIETIANVVPGGAIQITTYVAHGIPNNAVVNLKGIRGYPYLLGKWKVTAPSATTLVLVGSDRYNVSLSGEGFVELADYTLQPFTTFGYDGTGSRDTGVPFGRPRGKRPKKVLHR